MRFLPACVGYLAGAEPITREVLAAARSLKVISRNGAGVDAIDLAAAAERGIAVETAAGANAQGVAELAITLILAGLRHVPAQDAALKAERWERIEGRELAGRTLGVVGCGQIGRRVVRLGLGLGMSVRAFDALPDPGFAPAGNFAYTTMRDLLARSDAVTLHCPPAERPLIDRDAVAAMRPGAYLVNTARSALVEDGAVLEALGEARLGGYATDVYHREPPAPDELIRHPRVITTPHVGGYTTESVERATWAAVENLLRILTTPS
ncbi:NAD(P)-dependent oxidoreductase [Streptomyces sp. TS71-3]|uniref:NAD(P)-dependent oxidoreductase n=1 Tax=Streptomyces sp. TS71-3 TaxID=2733862 RepID=UPI001B0D589E|nr:NAD(P)-dependent oxidoreductase [Streptomyces sp. TS71-3]GHJ35529.1 oxidoreductase [Streptomyces sp. TS71-3]